LMAREQPRETHVLKRGDWLKPVQQITAGVPAYLHPLWEPERRSPTRRESSDQGDAGSETGAPGRLTFARWLVDKKSPTTARVIVNRLWQTYFGNGIVNTPEDFGMQSESPSHPELLDWLACELMEPMKKDEGRLTKSESSHKSQVNARTQKSLDIKPGTLVSPQPWSLKHIHRLI